jgi:hypothetical protein
VSGVVLAWIPWLSHDCFLLSLCPRLRARVGELETELLSVQGTLAASNNEYSELRVTVGSLCDAFGVVPAGAQEVAVREHLLLAFGQVRALMKDAFHFGVRRAFAVYRSHYEVNLVALSGGYLDAPDEVLDAADAEA